MADKTNQSPETQKRGFSLPTTSVKPPMPPVKEPKKKMIRSKGRINEKSIMCRN